jgi:hypothetical protein
MLKPQEDPPINGRVDGRYAGIGFRNHRPVRRSKGKGPKSDYADYADLKRYLGRAISSVFL